MIPPRALYEWCRIPHHKLESHPDRKIPFRLCKDSAEMGELMARELMEEIKIHNARGENTRAIIPCGPTCWYDPFIQMVNAEQIDLHRFIVFHMDECLDWQGRELPPNHPYSFRGFMERCFYAPVHPDLRVPEENRFWLNANNIAQVQEAIWAEPIAIAY